MVMGLTPVFLFWRRSFSPLSFYLSVGIGLIIGTLLASGYWPSSWTWFPGKYGDLLSANLVSLLLCLLAFWLPHYLLRPPATQSRESLELLEP